MVGRVQIKRTDVPNRAPTGLAPGELSVEMANPMRLWVGVPMTLDSSGKKLLIDGAVSAIDAYSKSESNERFVNAAGDFMTGDLAINRVNPSLYLNKASSAGQDNTIHGWTAGQRRWRVILGTTTAELGGNGGSDLAIVRHDDGGVTIDTPFAIYRNTGRTEIRALDVKDSSAQLGTLTTYANRSVNGVNHGIKHDYFLNDWLAGQIGLLSSGAFDGASTRSTYWRFNTLWQETLRPEMDVGNGVVLSGASGGAKGQGTLNATAIYDDNVQLTCYVLDAARNGNVDLAHWDDLAGGRNERAHAFAERLGDLDVRAFAKKWREQGFLPGAPEPRKRDPDIGQHHSVGDLFSMLLEIVEVQAVHIDQLASEIDALKERVATLTP